MATAIWLVNIQTLLIACFTIIAGRIGVSISFVNTFIIGEIFYIIGSFLFMIPQFQYKFGLALLARAIQNIGLGFCVSQQNTINKQYSKDGNIQQAIMAGVIILPIFSIIGSLLSGIFEHKFQLCYLIFGLIIVVFFIVQIIFFPIKFKLLRKLKIDIIATLLFCSSMCLILYGFMNFAQNKDKYILSLCLLIIGIVLLVLFIIYDQNFNKYQIIVKGLVNKQTAKGWGVLFLSGIVYSSVTTQMSSILQNAYYIEQTEITIFAIIEYIGILIASIVGSIANANIVTGKVLTCTFSVFSVSIFINGICEQFVCNKWIIYTFYVIFMFSYGIHLVITINWLFEFTPISFNSSLAIMNQVSNQIGQAFGATLTVLIVDLLSQGKNLQNQMVYTKIYGINDIIFGVIGFMIVIICITIPQYNFECKKKLYNPKKTKDYHSLFPQVYIWQDIIQFQNVSISQ